MLHDPNPACFDALDRALHYLHHTRALGLRYVATPSTTSHLAAYADASYGGEDAHGARSPHGHAIYFADCLIDWSSTIQSTVALSSAESEHISAFHCGRTIVYYRHLLEEMGLPQSSPTILHEDNEACIAQSRNPVNHKRCKHMLLKYHYLRDLHEMQTLKLVYVNTKQQVADIFTKPLPPHLFRHFLPSLLCVV